MTTLRLSRRRYCKEYSVHQSRWQHSELQRAGYAEMISLPHICVGMLLFSPHIWWCPWQLGDLPQYVLMLGELNLCDISI